MAQSGVLTLDDGPPVQTLKPGGTSPFLLVCEHASNRIPSRLDSLGVGRDVLDSHAARDPGALAVACYLSHRLDATLVAARFSRLVCDVNRPASSADAVRVTSEVYDVPGNADLSADQRRERIEACHHPFHRSLAEKIAERAGRRQATVLVTVHTFNPTYFGVARTVELGILHDRDDRLATALLAAAPGLTALRTERNQPYGPQDGVTHTLREHALPNGLLNVMIEIRNDLVTNEDDQRTMARLLADMLEQAHDKVHVQAALGAAGAA